VVKPGDIVIANILDPDGNPCSHSRPVMVLRASLEAANAWVVGISTKFSDPPQLHWLLLPF